MINKRISLLLLGLCACIGFSFVAVKITNESSHYSNDIAEGVQIILADEELTVDASSAIQIALLLDTSDSMDGLIEQAKSQLWNILNTLARTQKNDQESDLQIALYQYGNPKAASSDFYIHQLTEFTTDMDLISEKLFALTTNGGEEYCGAVIERSLEDLTWNDNEGLKIIYVAGNEPFNQGPVHFDDVCKQAHESGIFVNTIFCGDQKEGINGGWMKGAKAGGGDFVSIAQDEATVYIATPFDDEIERLNDQLNGTYIPYGKKGNEKKRNQTHQDVNAKKYSKSNVADRIAYKSSKKYKADDWDLVDAYKKDKSILQSAEIKSEEYSSMTIEELEANIEAVSQERESLQRRIQELDRKRREYREAEAQKTEMTKENSLQQSIIETLRRQAEKKGFVIHN